MIDGIPSRRPRPLLFVPGARSLVHTRSSPPSATGAQQASEIGFVTKELQRLAPGSLKLITSSVVHTYCPGRCAQSTFPRPPDIPGGGLRAWLWGCTNDSGGQGHSTWSGPAGTRANAREDAGNVRLLFQGAGAKIESSYRSLDGTRGGLSQAEEGAAGFHRSSLSVGQNPPPRRSVRSWPTCLPRHACGSEPLCRTDSTLASSIHPRRIILTFASSMVGDVATAALWGETPRSA